VGTDHALTLGAPGTLLFGAELQRQQASFKGPYQVYVGSRSAFDLTFDASEGRTVGSLYLADRVELGMFDLLAGLRLDVDQLFGQAWSPRATLGANLPTGTRLTLSYGEGFRAPGVNELEAGPLANSELKPEYARSVEAAAVQRFAKMGKASITVYRSWLRNLITAAEDPTAGGKFRRVNVDRSQMTGVELGTELAPGIARVGGSLTYTRGRTDAGDPLPDISEWLTSLHAGVSVSRLEADAFLYTWSGRAASNVVVPVTGPPALASTPAGNRLDLSASYWVSEGRPTARLIARVEDLLDRRDEEFPGFPAPGRIVFLGVEIASP
jgi:vitamin B12 transporter